MAERKLGPFLLNKKLGEGGMGVVYHATLTTTGQVVALKLLPAEVASKPKLVARFERELAILKKLKHPNIVPCLWSGKLENQLAMAMELVDGGTLAAELEKRKKLPWEEVIKIGQQICSALEHAHTHGIIHRDLKPSNLLRTKNGKIKLADFGIARDSEATALTAAGKTVGTFAYMSPEQIRGFPPVSPQSDLYSLGCVLYELLTGATPFTGETVPELLYQHIEKRPQPVNAAALDCPVWFDVLIQQMLEKAPEKRPRDAAFVAAALAEVQTKAAQNAAVLTHAASGMPTQINVTADETEVRSLLNKKSKKKSKDTSPFYEQTWFLSLCLAIVVGVVTWSFWPASEETLWAKARVMMETDDPLEWSRANDQYLSVLKKRFPEGASAPFVRDSIDKIEMRKAEDRLMNKQRLGKEPTSEGESLYAQARRYELFGDRVTALEMYAGMIQLMGESDDARPFVNLARRQIAAIESNSSAPSDRQKIVNDALAKAEEQYQSGNVVEANKIWNSIVALYEKTASGRNKELAPLVEKAKSRLSGKTETPGESAAGGSNTSQSPP